MGTASSAFGQSAEEIHRLVSAAAVQHRPITALYEGTRRLLCPHVLGYNQPGEWRVFCFQYGGETKDGPLPANLSGIWRCLARENSRSWKYWRLPGTPNLMLLNVV
jgi:hypothetical protein